jgi:hypothetical protein
MKSLNKHHVPVDYLHDSKIADCDKSDKISIKAFDGRVFDSTLSVAKTGSKILPFFFYNYTEVNFAVRLGQTSIDRDYSNFFRESFAIESQRMGCYSLTDDPAENDYTLEIVYNGCKTESKYQKNSTTLFLWFMYITNSKEIGFPATADLSIHAILRKGEETVLDKIYFINKTLPAIPSNDMDINSIQYGFVSNMAEVLSLGTKEGIEQIIEDINSIIQVD